MGIHEACGNSFKYKRSKGLLARSSLANIMPPRTQTLPLYGGDWTEDERHMLEDILVSPYMCPELNETEAVGRVDHRTDSDSMRLDASNISSVLQTMDGMYESMKESEDHEGGCAKLVCSPLCETIVWRVQPFPRTKSYGYDVPYTNDGDIDGLEALDMRDQVCVCLVLGREQNEVTIADAPSTFSPSSLAPSRLSSTPTFPHFHPLKT